MYKRQVLDKDGYVIGMIGGSVGNADWMCGEVARSSKRNSLGVLSSFIADSTQVTQVIDSVNLSIAVDSAKNTNADLLNPSNPDIKETYNWPKNAIVPSSIKYEEIIYDNNFFTDYCYRYWLDVDNTNGEYVYELHPTELASKEWALMLKNHLG